MAKLTPALREELAAYFFNTTGEAPAVAAQRYEPSSHHDYDPVTDMRLVTMLTRAKALGRSDWARVKRVIDDLPGHVVQVLYLALGGGANVGCCLPEALRQGRVLAENQAYERQLEAVFQVAHAQKVSAMTTAHRVLEADAEFTRGRRTATVDERTVRSTTLQAIQHGVIDVSAETERIIDGAVDAYVQARDEVGARKRTHKARLRREREALLDDLLGKKAAKESARFERRLKGAAA